MINRVFACLIFCVLCVASANAQHKVRGRVKGPDGNAVEYSSVRVLTMDSTYVSGTHTDEKGRYFLNLKNNGNYLVQFSAIGYDPQQVTITVVEPTTILVIPTVRLNVNSKQLSEVTVTADRMTRIDNHLLIIPDKTTVKHSFSTYELLNNLMLPGFDVNSNSGVVTLFGKDVTIYVDGVPPDYNMVRNLRAKDVERIEYHDVPTGRYSNDYAAINFIMRKYKFGGYANFDAQQCIGLLNGTYNGYAQFVRGNTQYHVTGGYSMWDMARDVVNSSEKYKFPDNPVDRTNKNQGGNTKQNTEYGQIRINNSNEKRQLSFLASVIHNNSDKNRHRLQIYSSPYDIEEKTYSLDKKRYVAPSLCGYAYFNLPKQQWTQVYAQANYSRQKRTSLYSAGDNSLPNNSEEDYLFAIISAGYGKTFRHNNSLYATVQEYFTTSSINYGGSYSGKQKLWNSVVWAGGQYRHQIKRVALNANVGFTITKTHVHGGDNSTDVNPNMSVEAVYRPTSKQQLRANMMIGLSTVGMAYLNDAEVQTDFLNARRGNPNLNSNIHRYGYTLNYSLQFGRFSAATNLNYGWDDNAVFNYYMFGTDKLIQTFENGTRYYFNGDLSLTWNACKTFRLNANGKYNFTESKSFMKRRLDNFGGSLNAMLFLGEFMINTAFHLPQETMSGWAITKSPFKYSIDVNWNHKNWSVKAWMTNPFNHIVEKVTMNVPQLSQYTETRKARNAMVKVTYTFDFGKKVQRSGVDRVNTSTSSAVL